MGRAFGRALRASTCSTNEMRVSLWNHVLYPVHTLHLYIDRVEYKQNKGQNRGNEDPTPSSLGYTVLWIEGVGDTH